MNAYRYICNYENFKVFKKSMNYSRWHMSLSNDSIHMQVYVHLLATKYTSKLYFIISILLCVVGF